MAIAITVPRLGWSMEEGTFAGWLKKDGEQVRPGDRLFVLESDKASEEIEALDGGVLSIPADAPQPGDTVQVGQVLAYLVEGEEKEEPHAKPQSRKEEEEKEEAGMGSPPPAPPGGFAPLREVPSASREVPSASPRARRVAKELGIDWTGLRGSGRNGRIRERDVRAAAGRAGGGRLLPHTDVRRTIAARMVAGVTQAAPVTLTTRADASNLVNLREQFKAASAPDEVVPGYTDLIVKLTALALRRHPLLQAQWRDAGLFVPDHVAIAVAVDTDDGLFAPVIHDADKLTLRALAAVASDLAERARAGKLSAEQMRNATFTVTNLGGLGIDAFTPILSLPQCAVLGVGRITREPAVVGEQVVPRERLTLSLTFDHRVVDGAPAARFLQTLCGCLENPAPWLMP